jgi:DNA-binding MarR family transcriptional regulator
MISMTSPEQCAANLLVGVPAAMRFIRREMRAHRHAELSVPQFRALVFVNFSEDRSVSAMAEHLGLSLPATSRTVDLLVQRGLLERRSVAGDRRRVALSLTAQGRTTYQRARRATLAAIAGRFASLDPAERALVSQAMQLLDQTFANSPALETGAGRRRRRVGQSNRGTPL